jgi:hypothetical protein
MKRRLVAALVALTCTAPHVRAQFNFVGPGSTVEGDYLRGVGIAAFGMGIYNRETAIANSINLDTAIRYNEYIYSILMNENKMNAEHRAAMVQRNKEEFEKLQKRIRENPEARDVDTGDALNSLLERLNDPKISDSYARTISVPLRVDDVKLIPFKLGEKGVKSFSWHRLAAKGRGNWPIAFQDNRFDRDRVAFERALDEALEQQTRQNVQIASIEALDRAIDNLRERLRRVIGESADRRYLEAKNHLDELKSQLEMFKSHQIEKALVELSQYAGTTVDDLRVFMRRHNLQFSRATLPDEKKLFPELYAKLTLQHDKVSSGVGIAVDAPDK